MSEPRPHQLHMHSPNLNVVSRIKLAMREAIKNSGLSYPAIAEAMNGLAIRDGIGVGRRGSKITEANLAAWCADSKPNLIPVNLLPVFCAATKNTGPLEALAAPLGAAVMDQEQRRLARWAAAKFESKRLAKETRRLTRELEGIYG